MQVETGLFFCLFRNSVTVLKIIFIVFDFTGGIINANPILDKHTGTHFLLKTYIETLSKEEFHIVKKYSQGFKDHISI